MFRLNGVSLETKEEEEENILKEMEVEGEEEQLSESDVVDSCWILQQEHKSKTVRHLPDVKETCTVETGLA